MLSICCNKIDYDYNTHREIRPHTIKRNECSSTSVVTVTLKINKYKKKDEKEIQDRYTCY